MPLEIPVTPSLIATPAAPGPAPDSVRLSCLLAVARVVNSSLELPAVLEQILERARETLDAESGSVMLLDDRDSELEVAAAHGPRAAQVRGHRRRLGEGIAGWVAEHRTPLLLHGSISDPRFSGLLRREDVRDALCVPMLAEEELLGVISLNNRRCRAPFSDSDLELLTTLSHQAALAIRNARAYQEMRRQRYTVERLLSEVTRAHEEERLRVALLLHDGPAQTLFAALRNVEAARPLAGSGAASLVTALDEAERSIRQAIHETRTLMLDLSPPCLEEMGLLAALRQYARQYEERTGIRTEVCGRGPDRSPPPAIGSALYRIALEALTNVWKHARARHAWLTLEIAAGACSLEIRDDGRGFRPEKAAADRDQHLGLDSLRDRAEMVGGRFRLEASPGAGTVVRVTVPLPDEGTAEEGQ